MMMFWGNSRLARMIDDLSPKMASGINFFDLVRWPPDRIKGYPGYIWLPNGSGSTLLQNRLICNKNRINMLGLQSLAKFNQDPTVVSFTKLVHVDTPSTTWMIFRVHMQYTIESNHIPQIGCVWILGHATTVIRWNWGCPWFSDKARAIWNTPLTQWHAIYHDFLQIPIRGSGTMSHRPLGSGKSMEIVYLQVQVSRFFWEFNVDKIPRSGFWWLNHPLSFQAFGFWWWNQLKPEFFMSILWFSIIFHHFPHGFPMGQIPGQAVTL